MTVAKAPLVKIQGRTSFSAIELAVKFWGAVAGIGRVGSEQGKERSLSTTSLASTGRGVFLSLSVVPTVPISGNGLPSLQWQQPETWAWCAPGFSRCTGSARVPPWSSSLVNPLHPAARRLTCFCAAFPAPPDLSRSPRWHFS